MKKCLSKKKSNIVSKYFLNNVSPFVGLIGFGYWGKNILRNLCELGVINTACDSNQNLISEQKKIFSGVNFTSSFDEVLQNKDIKAVAISTPAATHANFVKQSLLVGKDVFAGVPAKQIAWTCQCGTTLKVCNDHALCKHCGNEYILKNGKAIVDLSK